MNDVGHKTVLSLLNDLKLRTLMWLPKRDPELLTLFLYGVYIGGRIADSTYVPGDTFVWEVAQRRGWSFTPAAHPFHQMRNRGMSDDEAFEECLIIEIEAAELRAKTEDQIQQGQGDITHQQVEAVVNAANTSLLGGGGVDGAIHRAAGKELLEACRALNGCKTGQAKITSGFKLPARYVIHTVGPVWSGRGDGSREDTLLASCYRESLALAAQNDVKTIAFPSISTGVYSFPFERAARIAIREVRTFLANDTTLERVIFVCYSEGDFEQYRHLLSESAAAL